jgi:D-alanyl-D-alanine carboxypeptidase
VRWPGALLLVALGGVLVASFLILPRLRRADSADTEAAPPVSTVLAGMVETLPPDIRAGILASPQDFLRLAQSVLAEPPDLFTLVDKSHLLAPDFAPSDLVNLKDYSLPLFMGSVLVRRVILSSLLEMSAAARTSGITLVYSSGYRSFDYQAYVYAREVKDYGQLTADRESARPGASQHQLGTAIDFGSITDAFDQTPAGRWLAAHAWAYGFSLSYPQGFESVTGYRYEGWHYRFLTRAGTLLQKKYFGDVQQYMLEFLVQNREPLEALAAVRPGPGAAEPLSR